MLHAAEIKVTVASAAARAVRRKAAAVAKAAAIRGKEAVASMEVATKAVAIKVKAVATKAIKVVAIKAVMEGVIVPQQDSVTLESSENYSAHSLYLKLCSRVSVAHSRDIWALQVPLKLKFFLRQLARG
jgi:hypothetical protein